MLDKDGGEVSWDGKALNFDTCNIGYLAEERGLYPKYALVDQIRYFGELKGIDRKTIDERMAYWAERLKVEEYLYPEKAAALQEENEPASDAASGMMKRSLKKKKVKLQSQDKSQAQESRSALKR